MYFVYVLLSSKDRKLYIGYASDLQARLKKHWSGEVLSTAQRRPLKLIYVEVFLTSYEAMRREKFLKGGKGHRQLKDQIPLTLKIHKYKRIRKNGRGGRF